MSKYDKYKESAFTHEEMQPMIVETDMADMTDIVERLLNPANVFYEYAADKGVILREAADEIERLREALHYYADKSHWHVKYGDTYILVDEGRIARAALGEKE